MALTPEQQKARAGKLTASAIGALVSGNDEKIWNLYRELIGDPDYRRDDLSGVWPVQLGNATEQLNLDWYERKTGNAVTRRGDVVAHPNVGWAACTLDGWIEALRCPIECKHVGGREDFATIVNRYAAQCQWQIDITRSHQCIFSVIVAANEPRYEVIDHNPDFSKELWDRATHFMECVHSLTPPVAMPSIATEATIKTFRKINFQGNNEWASVAADWLEHQPSAEKAEQAEKSLKIMVPADCNLAFGHGITISRNKANRLTLKAA